MNMYTIEINGISKDFPKETTYFEICQSFGVQDRAIAVSVDNVIHHLSDKIYCDEVIEIVDLSSVIGNKIYKNGILFLFDIALKNKYPNYEVSYLHSIPNGVCAKINNLKTLTEEFLNEINEEMIRIIDEDLPIKKLNIFKEEAINYYNKSGLYEKASNIQNNLDNVITIYSLLNNHNYFYTILPYSTGILNNYKINIIDDTMFSIITPEYNGDLVLDIDYSKIVDCFKDGKNYLSLHNINYLCDINNMICDSKQIKSYILSQEHKYNNDLYEVAKKIYENNDIKFVLISGPSSSGKTTTCKKLAEYLRVYGYDTINISIDDYYINRDDTPVNSDGTRDFESPYVIDLKAFNNDLKDLLNYKEIKQRRYDFISGIGQYLENSIKLNDKSIVLIEGLHALNEELSKDIPDNNKFKIYLSPFIPLNIDRHNYVSTLDLRLIRRIIRDNRTRGYDLEKTLSAWNNVRKGESKYVFPYIPKSDVIINTSLSYEIGVLKVFVEPLLYSVNINSKYYEEARRLLKYLKPFYTIPGEYVPEQSVLREFIGGRYND